MIGRLVEIIKQGKDYGKFARVVKSLGNGNFRVVTTCGHRTVLNVNDMNKVM